MFPFLREAGFDPHIIYEPVSAAEQPDLDDLYSKIISQDFQIVYFQKVQGPSVLKCAKQLASSGVSTVYGVCDLVDIEMANVTSATIVVTEYMKSLYPKSLHSKIHVVHDGIENPEISKTRWSNNRGSYSTPLHALLVTSVGLDNLPVIARPPRWLKVTIVGRYPARNSVQVLRNLRWAFLGKEGSRARLDYVRFLADKNVQRTPWDPIGVNKALLQADIGIIPIDTTPESENDSPSPSWKLKSENRLTMKMSASLPVIATPIPAYQPVIEQGKNGYFAGSHEEWVECFNTLRDPDRRREVGLQARKSVLEKFSREEQAYRLLAVLQKLV
jgi:glycosyltransferase involved in cell wall biosynthesis